MGSPFVAHVVGPELLRSQVLQMSRAAAAANEFRLMSTELDVSQLVASIIFPSRTEIPCSLTKLPGGFLGIPFDPLCLH